MKKETVEYTETTYKGNAYTYALHEMKSQILPIKGFFRRFKVAFRAIFTDKVKVFYWEKAEVEAWVDVIREWHKDDPYPPIRPLAEKIVEVNRYELKSQRKAMVRELRMEGYRGTDRGDFSWKAKYGYRVKWYGEGYNYAVKEQNKKIKKYLEENETN